MVSLIEDGLRQQEETCSLLCPKEEKPKSVGGRWSWDDGSGTRQGIKPQNYIG